MHLSLLGTFIGVSILSECRRARCPFEFNPKTKKEPTADRARLYCMNGGFCALFSNHHFGGFGVILVVVLSKTFIAPFDVHPKVLPIG